MSTWLATTKSPDAQMLLLCFPHAGVGASTYRAWPRLLAGSGLDVCPVQLPGRESRMGEPPFRTAGRLVEALVRDVAGQLDRPFALFGHSMGALLAFELTRTLRDRGGPLPVHLFVSGRIAPQLADPRTNLHDLPDAELCVRLRDLGGMPPAVLEDPEMLAFLLPLLRADLEVNENYRYTWQPPLPVPITAFGGERDPKVTEGELRAWAVQTDDLFTARLLPGGHFFVQESAQSLVGWLVADLSRSLESPRANRSWR